MARIPRAQQILPLRGPARLRVRSVLLVGMVLPLLGIVVLAGTSVDQRWSERRASSELEHQVADVGTTIAFRAAVGQEEVRSTLLALATDLGTAGAAFDIDREREQARLRGARAFVDARRFAPIRSSIEAFADLDELRDDLDAGEAGYTAVSEGFGAIHAQIEDRWRGQMTDVEQAADSQPLDADVRARLRTLRESTEAFAHANARIRHALDIGLGSASGTAVDDTVAATVRYEAAVERASPVAGSLAEAAWTRFSTDPAVLRTDSVLDLAVELGRTPDPTDELLDPAALPTALTDGARWADLLQDLVQAAARDLEDIAADQVRSDTAAVSRAVIGTSLLSVLSIGLALLTARLVTLPVRDLEEAARRVEQGELAVSPISPRGPRELTATVRAFNDMAATLAGVERHAVALAEDPNGPERDDPLPGRTGRALQATFDRLRASIGEAEQHRQELAHLATHDGLTGLLTRAAAMEAVDRDLARARRHGADLLALFVDLDGLKQLNDTWGHAVGDEAIRRTADALASTTRDGDVVARLGGDEFLVVTPAATADEGALALAERIRLAVASESVEVAGGQRIALCCSVGIARSVAGADTVDGLVHAADVALYRAKRSGRGQVATYDALADPPDDTLAPEQLARDVSVR
ncbi:MAG: diguanylate cyclase [Acidimicrobiales bacterium]